LAQIDEEAGIGAHILLRRNSGGQSMAEAISRMSSLQKKTKGNTTYRNMAMSNNILNESFKSIGEAENQSVPGNPSDA
jgi:hypothetical protein